jgi:hypothetical protein
MKITVHQIQNLQGTIHLRTFQDCVERLAPAMLAGVRSLSLSKVKPRCFKVVLAFSMSDKARIASAGTLQRLAATFKCVKVLLTLKSCQRQELDSTNVQS